MSRPYLNLTGRQVRSDIDEHSAVTEVALELERKQTFCATAVFPQRALFPTEFALSHMGNVVKCSERLLVDTGPSSSVVQH